MDQNASTTPAELTPDPSAASSRNRTVALGAAALVFLLAIGVGAFVLLGNDEGSEPGMVFVIPAGSKADVVPELQSAISIPTDIRFGPDDVAAITIINEDDVTHRAGPFLVAAGQTYTQRFDKPGEFPIACSVDPAESIVVTVEG